MLDNASETRRLFVDFDSYTEGDAEFKRELCRSIVGNVVELKNAAKLLQESINHIAEFRKVAHKTTMTISILNDPVFARLVAAIKDPATSESEAQGSIPEFLNLANQIICSVNAAAETN